MKLNFLSQNFKGYDVAPLKAIHLEQTTSEPIIDEMNSIAQNEGFEIRKWDDYDKWTQDFKMIIEKQGKPHVVANNRVDLGSLENIQKTYGITSESLDFIATGGNTFIGKYPNGKKWMLIGESELKTKDLQYLSEKYGIDIENIFAIPQQNYHLDMFMRPIGYPYVLVDSPKLSAKMLSNSNIKLSPMDYVNINKNFKYFEQERASHYSSYKDTIKALEKAGFVPIETGGVFGLGINFMNAIVNQHKNGSISYITNSTDCDSPYVSSLEKQFEEQLRKKIPNLENIYFVHGKKEYYTEASNYMMDELNYRGGGIHCMTMEEPDFAVWG